MFDAIKALIKQPFRVITLILGVVLVGLPCVTVDKDYHWQTHPASTQLPVAVGLALLIFSLAAFALTFRSRHEADSAGLDLKRVKERDGVLSTSVNGCEIRVIAGRLEECSPEVGGAIVLPCNEYFDDRCVGDTKSALGAYVNKVFDGRAYEFIALVKNERLKKFGAGTELQKTAEEKALSFGAGQCLLIMQPLGHSLPVALISTTTQRAGQGLSTRISYLFDGMRRLVRCLADARIGEITMPLLGAGHGQIDPPLALVGLLLAVAEASLYGQGGQRLRRVTIVLFKRDSTSPAAVDSTVVRRALALVGSRE